MILVSIQQFIQQRRMVSLESLSAHFCRTPEVLSGMVEHWIRKGNVLKFEPTAACNLPCKQCHGCQPITENKIFYCAA